MTLAMATVVWLALICAAQWIAPRVGLTPHSARVTVVALILSAAAADPINAVLPVCAFIAALAARPAFSVTTKDHNLDFVAVVVAVGVVWLSAGAVAGRTALAFYVATFAAVTAGYIVLCLRNAPRLLRLGGAIVSSAIAIFLYNILADAMMPGTFWMPREQMIIISALATAGTAAIAALVSMESRAMAPGPSLAVIALLILLPAYVYEVVR